MSSKTASYKRNCFLCEPLNASLVKAHIVKSIVYEYDVNGNVKYAMCIFKRENRKDMFIKDKFKKIAEKRFDENPYFFKMCDFDNRSCEKKIINYINTQF